MTIEVCRTMIDEVVEQRNLVTYDEHNRPTKQPLFLQCKNKEVALQIYERYHSTFSVVAYRQTNSISGIRVISSERVREILAEARPEKVEKEEAPKNKDKAKQQLLQTPGIAAGTTLAASGS